MDELYLFSRKNGDCREFLLIGDDEDGFVNVDMIAMPGDTIVLKNLLSNNGLPPMRGAKSIMYTSAYTASMDRM